MYQKYLKRLFDITLSLVLIPLTLAIIIICGIIIKLDDGGPILYFSRRIGKGGRTFRMLKLRTMEVNAPDIRVEDGSTWNSRNDPRVTRAGKFLRETSLDEVPQVLNILKGDMSFIGPRPDPPDWLERYTDEERAVLSVLPGVTGYNQAYFRNSADGKAKILNDMYYVNNISFALDVRILLKTFISVIKHENIYTSQTSCIKKGKQ